MNYQEKLAAGFHVARKKAPYFDAALTGMVRVEVEGLAASSGIVGMRPTMGVTDTGVLMYERAAVEGWSVEEIAGVLLHEVGHLLRDHAGRHKRYGGHHAVFNMAGDCEINDDIETAGWAMPEGSLLPRRFGARDGLTAEEYYPLVESKVEYVQCCGSGAGHAFPNEPRGAGRTEAEIQVIRHRCAEAVSKYPGTVPGNWPVWAREQLDPPKIRWQDRLARATRRAIATRPGAVAHTWNKVSRRQPACGFGPGRPILPALSQPRPRIAVAVDTSGSMTKIELTIALREVSGVLRAVGASTIFVVVDATVHACREVRSIDDVVPLLVGGGGTDFRPAFEELRKSADRPELVVVATDGCGPAPEEEPEWCDTIWLLVGKSTSKPCAWGEFVEVRD